MQISVIIPSYNRAHCLEHALDSVLAQTYTADEIILVDDGSTDDTARLLADKYPMVRYLFQQNKGVSSARNLGISTAQYKWIALLDSDDEWLPTKLDTQVKLLAKQKDCPLCHTEEIWIRNGKRVNQMKKHKKAGGFIYQRCLPLCVISPSASLIKKSLLTHIGGFDENLPACEDYDLWLKICAQHPVAFVSEPQIIKHGGHEDQLSHHYPAMDRFRIQSLMKMLDAGNLSIEDTEATLAILARKLSILIQGAIKRDKHHQVEIYRDYEKRYLS